VVDQPAQFDFYDGGGLDFAALGAIEVDAEGSVNVTSFAGRFAGVGGFINISQNAKRLAFCFSFRAGDLEVDAEGGRLRIVKEGQYPKWVKRVAQVGFHGPSALARGQQVLYITERAVFELTPKGVELREVAPGVDLKASVLDLMAFAPVVGSPKLMPASCFQK
jgi:propionate CoA-transferase